MINVEQYWHFQSALSKDTCRKIIDYGESLINNKKSKGESTHAWTTGHVEKQALSDSAVSQADKTTEDIKNDNLTTYIRDSEVVFFNDDWIYDLLTPFLHKANFNAGWRYDFDFIQDIQFTKYGLNQFYGWHQDSSGCHLSKYKRFIPGISPLSEIGEMPGDYVKHEPQIGKVRKLSMTINLCDENSYEGGNLRFDFGPHYAGERYHTCTEIRPTGSIIVFPSHTYHQVTPVTQGTRYSLVLWACGKPFR
ncbi:putative 2OG-Fe(II) oxygenase [Pelagibacter phage Mosig EXVC030M]|nr:putative 2OG-Fe(II) oxygenase [Pelagibacter phage Mosig EXVC030M]